MRKVIEQLVDDITGEEIQGNGRTVTFSLDGTSYEIDLTDANIDELRKALEPYVAGARLVSAGTKAARRGAPASRASNGTRWGAGYEVVRQWAKENGIQVSERGRVANSVMQAYGEAHS